MIDDGGRIADMRRRNETKMKRTARVTEKRDQFTVREPADASFPTHCLFSAYVLVRLANCKYATVKNVYISEWNTHVLFFTARKPEKEAVMILTVSYLVVVMGSSVRDAETTVAMMPLGRIMSYISAGQVYLLYVH